MDHFQSPSTIPTLNHDEVHVWYASLEMDYADIVDYSKTLSSDEKERIDRFYFAKDRNNFIRGRGILRVLLGRYLKKDPSCIQLSYNTYGKPSLKCPIEANSLNFNVSHSDEKILYAFSKGLPLGIDLEYIRLDLSFESIAKRFFSPLEATMFYSLPEAFKAEAFFNCWTRKEAFVKAKGGGLSLELDQFDVSLRPGEPARVLRTRYDERDNQDWSLHDIDVGSEFKAALAVKSIKPQISCYSWCF
jgi:4'-phosphopantetheinyl transferase